MKNARANEKRRRGQGVPAPSFDYIAEMGGRTRRHKYLRDLRQFTFPIAIAILTQAAVYFVFILRNPRSDWNNMVLAVAALGLVPVLAGFVLTAFRRHDAPVVSSAMVVVVLYSMAISLLSAFRLPVSYVAIAACVPVGVGIMAYANIRFHRTVTVRAALAAFEGAQGVLNLIGRHVPVLPGPQADLSEIDLLLIDPKSHHTESWSALLAQCYLAGIEIMPWTRYMELRNGRLDVSSFDVSHIVYSPSQLLYARAKRLLDLFAVLVSLPITLPIGFIVAAYIFLRDGGPVIFVQIRRGFGGKRFRVYKFRTMYKGTSGGATVEGDSRIIKGCRIVRKLRLDELPQLFNILIGDMSLIGPRPVAEEIARKTERHEPKYALRSLVLPGITGWAQVSSGYAGNIDQEIEKLSYDLYYIKHLSLDLEILIMFKTIRTVLFGTGAR